MLWIAFKSLYLCSLKQHLRESQCQRGSCKLLWENLYLCSLEQQFLREKQLNYCCELLSKVCIFVVWNNTSISIYIQGSCELLSKVCIFVVWNNPPVLPTFDFLLWIAFKNLYLCSLKQHLKSYITPVKVVNCFQKFVSL